MLNKFRTKIKLKVRGQRHDDSVSVSSTNNENALAAETDIDTTSIRDANAAISQKEADNLWEVAGKKLEEKHRIALNLENAPPVTESIDEVIKTTEEKYREYKEGGAKDLVQTLISFDSTGYASSAWSVVSIGLTLIQNDIERRDDIFEASEYLAGRLSYYTIFESTYRSKEVESDKGLEGALVEVYTAILEYTAEVKKAIQECKADLTSDLDRKKQAEGILDGIDEAVERLKEIQSHTRSLQEREILDWLSTASYSDTQNDVHERRTSDTGNWFLNHPVYIEWKATPGKICWGYGAVGCGKSVLCSTVIQDIEDFCKSDPSRKFAYWYFQFSNDETQKVYNMTRSILRQLMPRILPSSLVKLWEDHGHRGSKPQQQKFADVLDIVLEDSQDKVFLIIDAMDECPVKDHDGRSSLLEFIEQLLSKHPSKLHILATSRPEPDIRSRLEQYLNVDLEIGRFRWADLQIKRLQESKNEAAFNKALDTIPATLEDTYRDILERLSSDDREAARTILIWLSFSLVPMDLKTVADVVSFNFPDDVIQTCTTSSSP
ncbi:protein kinase domain family protein [Penicillium hetheringtonii]|uniref:Protein kinase domain family protein n=1 Tax=Penicillium hetheringtonii TaxID=911720 RepID=A0AAD6GUN4_9EURO|nr:protein kinase domain family protein [Penicillium hetheringtonii]